MYNWSSFQIPFFLFLNITDQGVNIYRKPPIYKQHGKWPFPFYFKVGVSTELKTVQLVKSIQFLLCKHKNLVV